MNLKEYLSSIPKEEIERNNIEELARNKEYYEEFRRKFAAGYCLLCESKLDEFNADKECFHWFLKPKGFKKKLFKDYLKRPIGYFKLESYLRWVASIENSLKNVNDSSFEMSESKIREVTIKYKNFEWSLCFGQSDLLGHKSSIHTNFPHFHFQMTVDNKPFLNYNDYHIPFSEYDLFDLQLMNEAPEFIDFRFQYGEGISTFEKAEHLEFISKGLKVASEPENALFRSQTLVVRPNGQTMSTEILQKVQEESEKTKIPMRDIIAKYYPDAQIITEFVPGPGVPSMKTRNKR